MTNADILVLDFDGVIRNKETNEPIFGALEGCYLLLDEYHLIVQTCRTDTEWVSNWLEDHGFPFMKVTNKKPVALVYLDDHGQRFDGSWENALAILKLHPHGWNDKNFSDYPQTETKSFETGFKRAKE
jgi:hypothetical protein